MQMSRKGAVAMLATASLAGSAATGALALAHSDGHGHGHGDRHGHKGHHSGQTLAEMSLAPSVPNDPMIHGVTPGGAPWVLRSGEVKLRHDGRLSVRMRGLVIPTAPSNGTPGPVTTVSASLYCGDDTTAEGTTPASPISRAGDARVSGKIDLPAKCLAPVVLVHPNDIAAAYIAAGGFGG
jgi:hypothetical protein